MNLLELNFRSQTIPFPLTWDTSLGEIHAAQKVLEARVKRGSTVAACDDLANFASHRSLGLRLLDHIDRECCPETGLEEITGDLLEADFLGTWDPFDDHSTLADLWY